MTQRLIDVRLGMAFRQREILSATETSANRTRKYLLEIASKMPGEGSGTIDDAVKLAELIEKLAHLGQTLAAADALDIGERVEQLLELLCAEIDAILAS